MEPDPVGHLCSELGEDKLREIVCAFYAQVPGDELLGAIYPAEDLAGAEERLADFLVQRCGGPTLYESKRGHPRLRMRHAPFGVDLAARDRWMALMTQAIESTNVAAEPQRRLVEFLGGVATFLVNRPGGIEGEHGRKHS